MAKHGRISRSSGRPPAVGPTRSRGLPTRALVCLALSAAACLPAVGDGGGTAAEEIRRLEADNALLQIRADLAAGKEFYLVLDPTRDSLKLMLKGAVLQDYRIVRSEAGAPRLAFVSRGLPAVWRGRVWAKGTLYPYRDRERVEIEAPPPSDDPSAEPPPPPIPPTPEEAYPVPFRYHVRFEGGLSLEVVRAGETEAAKGWWESVRNRWASWWRDIVAVLSRSSPEADEIRLRLTLSSKGADSLYRALPPDVALLVLP